MKDEKFISIEYDRWVNHYLPLEEENKRLRYDLEHRDITIYIHRSYGFGHTGLSNVGTLSVYINGGYQLKSFDKAKFLHAIENDLGIQLKKTKEEEERLIAASEKINNLPRLIKWLFKIKP